MIIDDYTKQVVIHRRQQTDRQTRKKQDAWRNRQTDKTERHQPGSVRTAEFKAKVRDKPHRSVATVTLAIPATKSNMYGSREKDGCYKADRDNKLGIIEGVAGARA